jgi:hypothetical protein
VIRVQIRYKELAPGLHGKAELRRGRTVVYLVPGLTDAQRKAALRRLRQEAGRGCGPQLPLPQLAVALAADRIRAASRNTTAVVRLHPAGSIVPTMMIGCLTVLFVLTSVSVRIMHRPVAAGQGGVSATSGSGTGTGPRAVSRMAGSHPANPEYGKPGGSGGVGGYGGAASNLLRNASARSSRSGAGETGPGSGSRAGSGSGASSDSEPGSGSGAGPSSGSSASVSVNVPVISSASAIAGPFQSPSPSPFQSPFQSPSPSPSSGGSSGSGGVSVCVTFGPFGGCAGL